MGSSDADAIANEPTNVIVELVSTSANDADAGTGVQTVRVAYLDTSYDIQWTNVTMDGTTPVDLIDDSTAIMCCLWNLRQQVLVV